MQLARQSGFCFYAIEVKPFVKRSDARHIVSKLSKRRLEWQASTLRVDTPTYRHRVAWKRRSGRRLRPPCSLCQVMSIKRLPDKRFDDCLADVKVLRSIIQFFQHRGGDVYVNPLNGLNHAASALEKS
jgi:hypothetical protein